MCLEWSLEYFTSSWCDMVRWEWRKRFLFLLRTKFRKRSFFFLLFILNIFSIRLLILLLFTVIFMNRSFFFFLKLFKRRNGWRYLLNLRDPDCFLRYSLQWRLMMDFLWMRIGDIQWVFLNLSTVASATGLPSHERKRSQHRTWRIFHSCFGRCLTYFIAITYIALCFCR